MSILVDSTVWIDYFNGAVKPQTEILDFALGRKRIIVGDLILAEVMRVFRVERDYEEAREALSLFTLVRIGGREVALQSAEHYQLLRRQGVTVRKTIDCLIATYCIHHEVPLLHSDRDFKPFEELLGLETVTF